MLTTLLDLLGLACVVAAVLVAAGALFGVLGLCLALVAVAIVALGASWLVDRLRP